MIRLRFGHAPEPIGWDDGTLTQMRRDQQLEAAGPAEAEWTELAWREINRMQAQHWWKASEAEFVAAKPKRARKASK